jgi:hypothetical protein
MTATTACRSSPTPSARPSWAPSSTTPPASRVSTIEHLMAALAALAIDNCHRRAGRPRSADHGRLVRTLRADPRPRRAPQAGRRPPLYRDPRARWRSRTATSCASLTPSDRFEVAFEIAFSSKAIGRQRVDLTIDEDSLPRRAGQLPHLRLPARRRGPARHGPGPRRFDGERRGHRRRPGAQPRRPAPVRTSSCATRRWTRSATSMSWARRSARSLRGRAGRPRPEQRRGPRPDGQSARLADAFARGRVGRSRLRFRANDGASIDAST